MKLIFDNKINYSDFGKTISIEDCEKFVSVISSGIKINSPLVLDLKKTKYLEPVVGSILGNTLRRYADKKLLKVILPKVNKNNYKNILSSNYIKSNLLQSILLHTDQIYNNNNENINKDIQEILDDFYNSKHKPRKQYISIADIHSNNLHFYDSYDLFYEMFSTKLKTLFGSKKINSLKSMDGVFSVCYEASQNIVDHANKLPFDDKKILNSYLTISYHNKLIAKHYKLAAYLKSLGKEFSVDGSTISFIEIIINDDGLGIAARQSLDANIYWRNHSKEKAIIEKAFSAGGTVKFGVNDSNLRHDPGFGFAKICQKLESLKAYATIRTGRSLYVLNSFSRFTKNEFIFTNKKNNTEYGYVPGTLIHILVPITEPQIPLI